MAMGRKSGLVAAAIVVGLAVAVGAAVAIFEHLDSAKHDSIGVFDLQVDKERRAWVDIIFDHPVSVAHPGAIVHPLPATVHPDIGGVWRWRTPNVLRFEPQGGFAIGSTYSISLKTARFASAGERFRGNGELSVKIDRLMVEKVVTTEEPAADPKSVVVHGEIYFNYPVDPAMLVTQAALVDGGERQPIELVDM